MIIDDSIFVRYVALPRLCRAITVPNSDSTWSVYVNSSLPEEWQEKALKHELNHIRLNHFYDEKPVIINEQEAG